jgi:1-acyl-sn-glycerol-3-phosphate acyltransferase
MEPYIPQVKYDYPEKLDQHMIDMKYVHELTLDANYPFLDKSFGFRFVRALEYIVIYIVVFHLCVLRFGLKIEGRDILRKHRTLLKNGAMTISNHIHKWDLLFVLKAIRYRSIYFPVWKENLKTPERGFIRYTGGIPIPESISLMKCYNKAFDEICAKKKWIHAYPETAMFYFYQPIRPFKKGVFSMAYHYNLPIIPMAFSYRKPCFPFTIVNLFRTIIGNQKLPMVTLRIGEPLLFDTTLGRKEAVQKMRKDCHEAIVHLAGIKNNPYPAEDD